MMSLQKPCRNVMSSNLSLSAKCSGMWEIGLEIASKEKEGNACADWYKYTCCNCKNFMSVRNQMENDSLYAKGRCAAPPYSSVPGVQRNRGGKRRNFETGIRQSHARNVGGGRGAEGLSALRLLAAPAGLGPGIHHLSPHRADTDG